MRDSLYLALAAARAEAFVGATAPNPPVGACIVRNGQILAIGAHARAGTDHAEVVALKKAAADHGVEALQGATIYVTLEPCNHVGRTGACTQALLDAGIARVVYAASDPNPKVKGGGAEWLRARNIKVELWPEWRSERLLDGFGTLTRMKRPWIVHKLAYRLSHRGSLSMIPDKGDKTFTRIESLRVAHQERKKCDAVLTTLDTIVADAPLLNVRHVADHAGKNRTIAVVSRTARAIPEEWLTHQLQLGHEVVSFQSLDTALFDLGQRGVLRLLVEAGPKFSAALETMSMWDERLTIISLPDKDEVFREYNKCSRES